MDERFSIHTIFRSHAPEFVNPFHCVPDRLFPVLQFQCQDVAIPTCQLNLVKRGFMFT